MLNAVRKSFFPLFQPRHIRDVGRMIVAVRNNYRIEQERLVRILWPQRRFLERRSLHSPTTAAAVRLDLLLHALNSGIQPQAPINLIPRRSALDVICNNTLAHELFRLRFPSLTLHFHLMGRDIIPQSLVAGSRRRELHSSSFPSRTAVINRTAALAVLSLHTNRIRSLRSLILGRISHRRFGRGICGVFGCALVEDPDLKSALPKKENQKATSGNVPNSSDMRIAFEDGNLQACLPEMDRRSHATDSGTDDADGLDLEVLTVRHFLASILSCVVV